MLMTFCRGFHTLWTRSQEIRGNIQSSAMPLFLSVSFSLTFLHLFVFRSSWAGVGPLEARSQSGASRSFALSERGNNNMCFLPSPGASQCLARCEGLPQSLTPDACHCSATHAGEALWSWHCALCVRKQRGLVFWRREVAFSSALSQTASDRAV